MLGTAVMVVERGVVMVEVVVTAAVTVVTVEEDVVC